MRTTKPPLTASGYRLYWIHRGLTKMELTPEDFRINVIEQEPWGYHECESCGEMRTLAAGLFCIPCIRGAVNR